MNTRIVSKAGWIALGAAAVFGSTRADAEPVAAAASVIPDYAFPSKLHMGFRLEPESQGVRRLVLVDDLNLRIPLVAVDRLWACDAQIDGGQLAAWHSTYELDLGCAGGVIRAGMRLDDEDHAVIAWASRSGDDPQSFSERIGVPEGVELHFDTELQEPGKILGVLRDGKPSRMAVPMAERRNFAGTPSRPRRGPSV